MRHRLLLIAIAAAFVSLPRPAHATITFQQLDDDMFVVSHRVKIIGSRGQAMDMAYTKAASLCVAAGYSHFEILQQESEAEQSDDSANASLRVRFYPQDGEDRIDCARNADPKYVRQAEEKLRKRGYSLPEATSEPAGAEAGSGSATGEPGGEAPSSCAHGCTIEQIAAMARAGLSDEQISAACQSEE